MAEWKHPMPPFPRAYFERIRAARSSFRRVTQLTIPPNDPGKAFLVKKGQSARIICLEGPQIADVCFWNANDHKERFWNEYTLNREGIFVTTFKRLWSNMPKFRPMMTIIEDTVKNLESHPGARHHYVFGAHCNPHVWYWVTHDKTHPYVTTTNCYYNLIHAIKPFGMTADDLHDNLNLFMKCYIDPDTSLHPVEASDAKRGDYMEFYAEMDVLIGVSLCPSGSGRQHLSQYQYEQFPLGIEIYDTGIDPPPYEDPLNL